MPIQVGDKLPDATFKIMTADGPAQKTTTELFAGKKAVLFAVPGAYTPSCHSKHLPSYKEHAADLKAKGIESIACVAVNDIFVLDHWAKETGTDQDIQFLSDGNGDFTKALGLEFDGSAAGLGLRSRRYAMIVEDGVVKTLNIEETPGAVDVSNAQSILKAL